MFFFWDQGGIAAPVVGVIGSNIENLQLCQQFLTKFVLPTSKNERQDASRRRVDGRPKPALLTLVAHVAPLFIYLNIPRRIKEMPDSSGNFVDSYMGIDIDYLSGLFFSSEITVFLPMPRTRAVSRTPLPLMAISAICSLTPGS